MFYVTRSRILVFYVTGNRSRVFYVIEKNRKVVFSWRQWSLISTIWLRGLLPHWRLTHNHFLWISARDRFLYRLLGMKVVYSVDSKLLHGINVTGEKISLQTLLFHIIVVDVVFKHFYTVPFSSINRLVRVHVWSACFPLNLEKDELCNNKTLARKSLRRPHFIITLHVSQPMHSRSTINQFSSKLLFAACPCYSCKQHVKIKPVSPGVVDWMKLLFTYTLPLVRIRKRKGRWKLGISVYRSQQVSYFVEKKKNSFLRIACREIWMCWESVAANSLFCLIHRCWRIVAVGFLRCEEKSMLQLHLANGVLLMD